MKRNGKILEVMEERCTYTSKVYKKLRTHQVELEGG
jgi:hypothetical protein